MTEGHPDKMCDQISDAVLDAILTRGPGRPRRLRDGRARPASSSSSARSRRTTYVDIPTIVRDTVRDIGYNSQHYGFDWETCGVIVSIKEQSRDIAMGVDKALEAKKARR